MPYAREPEGPWYPSYSWKPLPFPFHRLESAPHPHFPPFGEKITIEHELSLLHPWSVNKVSALHCWTQSHVTGGSYTRQGKSPAGVYLMQEDGGQSQCDSVTHSHPRQCILQWWRSLDIIKRNVYISPHLQSCFTTIPRNWFYNHWIAFTERLTTTHPVKDSVKPYHFVYPSFAAKAPVTVTNKTANGWSHIMTFLDPRCFCFPRLLILY